MQRNMETEKQVNVSKDILLHSCEEWAEMSPQITSDIFPNAEKEGERKENPEETPGKNNLGLSLLK